MADRNPLTALERVLGRKYEQAKSGLFLPPQERKRIRQGELPHIRISQQPPTPGQGTQNKSRMQSKARVKRRAANKRAKLARRRNR